MDRKPKNPFHPGEMLLEEFLVSEAEQGSLELPLSSLPQTKALLHGHCHQKAFAVMPAIQQVLMLIPELQVEVIDSGCCGMAGAFGYQAEQYEISMKMAELSLLPAVRAADGDTLLVANGTSCRHQIEDGAQRSARHIASATDVKQAYAVGKAAVEFALKGKTAVMPVIKRVSDKPYRWRIDEAPLSRVANKEKMLPRRYITKDGFGITEAARRYLQPLIRGEDYPPYVNGLPKYVELKNVSVAPQLKTKFVV